MAEGNIWTWQYADLVFGRFIHERDRGCVLCRRPGAPSHWKRRSIWGTRWDPDNVDELCIEHHEAWEHDKEGAYRRFKERQLGPRLAALEERARAYMSRREAIERAMEWLRPSG